MKTIKMTEYANNLGILIDVRHPLDFKEGTIHKDSKNIYYDKLIYNHSKYLNKNNKYYIICLKGKLSKKAVIHLEYLGYDVTLVIR